MQGSPAHTTVEDIEPPTPEPDPRCDVLAPVLVEHPDADVSMLPAAAAAASAAAGADVERGCSVDSDSTPCMGSDTVSLPLESSSAEEVIAAPSERLAFPPADLERGAAAASGCATRSRGRADIKFVEVRVVGGRCASISLVMMASMFSSLGETNMQACWVNIGQMQWCGQELVQRVERRLCDGCNSMCASIKSRRMRKLSENASMQGVVWSSGGDGSNDEGADDVKFGSATHQQEWFCCAESVRCISTCGGSCGMSCTQDVTHVHVPRVWGSQSCRLWWYECALFGLVTDCEACFVVNRAGLACANYPQRAVKGAGQYIVHHIYGNHPSSVEMLPSDAYVNASSLEAQMTYNYLSHVLKSWFVSV